MNPTERIEVRKVYIKNVALFGLLYGLVIGMIIGVFLFVRILLGAENITLFGKVVAISNMWIGIAILFGSVIFYAIAICIASAICALLYNLIASIGGALHVGLAESEIREQ